MKYILLLIFLISLIISGCSGKGCAYKNWLVEDSVKYTPEDLSNYPNITFEYPNCFPEVPLGRFPTNGMDVISFEKLYKDEDDYQTVRNEGWYADLEIGFIPSDQFIDLKGESLDITTFSRFLMQRYDEVFYEFLGSRPVFICNSQTESRKYLEKLPGYEDNPYKNRIFTITHVICGNVIVTVFMNSPESEVEEVEEYYNHLLETFKFLE